MLQAKHGRSITTLLLLFNLIAIAPCCFSLPYKANSTVVIVRGNDIPQMLTKAINALGGIKSLVKANQKVVIKPNIVFQAQLFNKQAKINPAITTDPLIIRALIQLIQSNTNAQITIAEGSTFDTAKMFNIMGYPELAKQLGVKLVDLNADKRITVKSKHFLGFKQYPLPVTTQNSDVFIDVAKLKTHELAGVTLGMKNLMSLLPTPKYVYHVKLNRVLYDLNYARKPDLTIIDGIIAMEGQGPLLGEPVEMHIIIAGRNVVSVDAVACYIMGIDPHKIKYLQLADDHGLGQINLNKIVVKGSTINAVKREFKFPHQFIEIENIPSVEKKLFELAHTKYVPGQHVLVLFDENQLRATLDPHLYPVLLKSGFTIKVVNPTLYKGIRFILPYSFFDHGDQSKQAEAEMRAWIKNNLGKQIKFMETDIPT